ncbi:hypothetical protein [Amycolatopsis sp. cmx-4-54]|uniref:hypothetical protein n=1 Tax=Amycolatopsis sp. cmx-4-54 TaxID=2790936 RepID=UPI00397DFAB8
MSSAPSQYELTLLYLRLAKKIRDEWPHDIDTVPNHESGILLGFNRWKEYAIEGDIALFEPSVASESLLGAVFARRERFRRAQEIIRTIRDMEVRDWSGDAATQFHSYLGMVNAYLTDFIGEGVKIGERHGYLQQVSSVLDTIYAVQLAQKNDLREIALALDAAIDRMDDVSVDYRPAAIFGLKLALIAVKQIPKAELVIEVAELMRETSGLPEFKLERADTQEITGHEIIGVLQSFDRAFEKIATAYDDSIAALNRHLGELITEVERNTELTKLTALLAKDLPAWTGHGGKSLRDLLSLGENIQLPAINERAGEEKAPPIPEKEENRPPGPPGPPIGT